MNKGWKSAKIQDIPPIKDSWAKGWHSVRHYFGITGFGVNAATKDKGESITPTHNEKESGHQELFVVLEGRAEFKIGKDKATLVSGEAVAIEPEVDRSATALETPTTVLIIGSAPGKAYEIAPWEKV